MRQYLRLVPRILPVDNSVGAALDHHPFALVISTGVVHVLAVGVLQIGGFDGRDDGVVGRRDVVDDVTVVAVEERGGRAGEPLVRRLRSVGIGGSVVVVAVVVVCCGA